MKRTFVPLPDQNGTTAPIGGGTSVEDDLRLISGSLRLADGVLLLQNGAANGTPVGDQIAVPLLPLLTNPALNQGGRVVSAEVVDEELRIISVDAQGELLPGVVVADLSTFAFNLQAQIGGFSVTASLQDGNTLVLVNLDPDGVQIGDEVLVDLQPLYTHEHTVSQLTDSTVAGRVLLTAVDAEAQKLALGLGTAAEQDVGYFAESSHTHSVAQVTGLQGNLDGKADTAHTHDGATTLVAGFMSATDKTKLNSVWANATENMADDDLLARENHTGEQPIASVTGLQTQLDNRAALVHGHFVATTMISGFMSTADRMKLDGLAPFTGSAADLTSGVLPTGRLPALTGDVSSAASSNIVTLNTGAVTNTKQASVASQTLKGRISAGIGVLEDLSMVQVRTMLALAIADVVGLQAAIDGRAALVHAHAITDVTSLQTELNNRSVLGHNHAITDTTGLQAALNLKADLISPALTGTPTAPTAAVGTNTTQVATTAFVRATRLDQLAAPTATVSMGSQRVSNLAEPINGTDAATKTYVDLAAQGLTAKGAVRVATTTNLAALSGLLTVDSAVLVANDRVLVKDQTTQSLNGIYLAQSGAWTRAADSDTWNELRQAFVFVENGTVNNQKGYLCSIPSVGTLGTDPVIFSQFSAAGQIEGGNGLVKTGSTLDVGAGTGISVLADSVQLAGQVLALHNLATSGVIVRTGADTFASRSLATGTTGVSLSNADGISGNPTISLSAPLSAMGGLTPTADTTVYYTGASSALLTSLTAFGRSLIDDADAATARGTLGLGSLSTLSTVLDANITAGTITNSKLTNVASATIKGRVTAGSGSVEDLTTTQVKTMLGLGIGDITGLGTLAALSSVNLSTLATGTLQAAQFPVLTGDVSTSAGNLSVTIGAGTVTNTKQAAVASGVIKGRVTAGSGQVEDLTVAQVKTLLALGITDVSGLQTALNGKAATAHAHVVADVTGLQTALDGKAASTHAHVVADITGLAADLSGKADAVHVHDMADVTGLTAALSGKSATSHTHAAATVSVAGFMSAGDKTKLDGIASGATVNASDASLRDRATHTGTQAVATITGLSAVATSGSAADLGSGTLPAARLPALSGDVSSTGGTAVTAIGTGVVTNTKLTTVPTGTLKGRVTAGTGSPEDLTPAQAKSVLAIAVADVVGLSGDLAGKSDLTHTHSAATTSVAGFMSGADKTKLDSVASGATANASDASLRDRSTHTGTQAAATVTGLASVATSGSAADLSAGTLLAARLPAFSGDVSSSVGSSVSTIGAGVVTNAKLAAVPTATIKGRITASTGVSEDLTAAQAKSVLAITTGDVSGLSAALALKADLASPTLTGVPAAPTAANGTNTTQLATTAFVRSTRLDQLTAPTASVSMGNQRITSLLDPVNPTEAATKAYVDSAASGLSGKASVVVATTANIATLSGLLTVDGVTTVANDRVLVKDQTTQSQNGIYTAAAGAWTRATDTDTWIELRSAFVFVESGTVNTQRGFLCSIPVAGTLGTDPVPFTLFSSAGQITGGAGLVKTGSTLDVVGTSGIVALADSIQLTGQALALHNLATNGMVVRTAADTLVGRSFATSGSGLGLSNADGVSGNPTMSLSVALSTIGGLTPAADQLPYYTTTSAAALTSLSTFGRSLIDDVDASAGRTTLGLGSLATLSSIVDANVTAGTLTNAKLVNVATATIKGRTTAGSGSVEDLTATQVKTLLAIAQADVSGLTAALAGKTDTGHTHIIANTTGLQAALDAKVDDSQLSAFGLTLVDDADATAARTTLGLGSAATSATSAFATAAQGTLAGTALQPAAIGASVQAYDGDLQAIASLVSAADRIPYYTGAGTAALTPLTAFGRSLADDADAAAGRVTLGLGTAAVAATGDFATAAQGTLAGTALQTGAFGLGGNYSDKSLDEVGLRTQFFRANAGVRPTSDNYHTLLMTRVNDAQSSQFLVRDGASSDRSRFFWRHRGGTGVWSDFNEGQAILSGTVRPTSGLINGLTFYDTSIGQPIWREGAVWKSFQDLVGQTFGDTQHGTRAGGTQHAVATTSVAGFMSAADKTQLNLVGTQAGSAVAVTDRIFNSFAGLMAHTGSFADGTIIATIDTGGVYKAVGGTAGTRHLTTAGSEVLEVQPGQENFYFARHFGAVDDETTDAHAALTKMVAQVKHVANLGKYTGGVFDGNFLISQTLVLDAAATWLFKGKLKASGTFTINSFMIDIMALNGDLINLYLECNHRAAGVKASRGQTNISYPTVNRFKYRGISLESTVGGDTKVFLPSITQIFQSDVALWDDDANFDGDGIVLARADDEVIGGIIRYCGKPIRVLSTAKTSWITGVHPYNGRPPILDGNGDVVSMNRRLDPKLIVVEAGASGINIQDCYLDNGQVDLYSPSVAIRNCRYLFNNQAVDVTNKYLIGVFANGQTSPYQLDIDCKMMDANPKKRIIGTPDTFEDIAQISYRSFGANSWTGVYTGFDGNIPDAANITATAGRFTIFHREGSGDPFETFYKPDGFMRFAYRVGAVSGNFAYQDWGPDTTSFGNGSFRFKARAGVSSTAIYIGDTGNNGLTHSGTDVTLVSSSNLTVDGNEVILKSGGANRVIITSTGHMRPASNDAVNNGAVGFRWKEIFAINGTINTSDQRLKTIPEEIEEVERRIGERIRKELLKKYRWITDVEKLGDAAKYHYGLMAQEVVRIFDEEGYDWRQTSVVRHDKWDAEPAIFDENGRKIHEAVEAGDVWSVNPTELMYLMMSSM